MKTISGSFQRDLITLRFDKVDNIISLSFNIGLFFDDGIFSRYSDTATLGAQIEQ